MDCVITVKGQSHGKYGHSKYDKTEAISKFLAHNQVLYKEVFKHVVKCDKCDPDQIMERYFSSREKMKSQYTSSTFVDLVRRYKLHVSSKLKQDWLRKLILSSVEKQDFSTVCMNSDVLSKNEMEDFLYKAFIQCENQRSTFMNMILHLILTDKTTTRRMSKHDDAFQTFVEVCKIFETRPVNISYEEYVNLASVSGVLTS